MENQIEQCKFFIIAGIELQNKIEDDDKRTKMIEHFFDNLKKEYTNIKKDFHVFINNNFDSNDGKMTFEEFFEMSNTNSEYYNFFKSHYNDHFNLIKINKKIYVIEAMKQNREMYEDNYTIKTDFEVRRIYSIDRIEIFDEDLEKLKIDIKDYWMKKINEIKMVKAECFWVEDQQSDNLCLQSYCLINKLENKLRAFINIVMTYYIGINWSTEIIGKTAKTATERQGGYQDDVKSFSDINSYLLSINSDDLGKVLSFEEKTSSAINEGYLKEELKESRNANKEEAKAILEKIYNKIACCELSYWNTYFSRFFDMKKCISDKYISKFESNFVEKWTEFCKKRNHIAHNKFVDFSFYLKLQQDTIELNRYIDDANALFLDEVREDDKLIKDEEYADLDNDDYYAVIEPYSHSHKYRIEQEEEMIHILSIKFRFIKESLLEKIKTEISLNKIFDKDLRLEVNSTDSIDEYHKKQYEYYNKMFEFIKESYINEIMVLKYNDIELSIIRKGYNTYYDYIGYELKLYISGEEIETVNFYHNGQTYCCEGIPELNELLGGNFQDFCNTVINKMSL